MSRRVRRVLLLAVVSLLATGVAACGDDEDRLSKAKFTDRLNTLCKERDKEFEVLDEANFFNMEEGAEVWADLEGVAATYVEGVEELSPPEDAQDLMDGYLEEIDAVVDHIGDVAAAAEDGDQRAYSQGLADLFGEFSLVDKQIDEYGATDCHDDEEAFPVSEEPAEGATEVEIVARDYAFEIPAGIKAGKIAFTLTNKGEEMHIFSVGKLKAGATFDQLKQAIEQNPEGDPNLVEDEFLSPVVGPEKPVTFNVDLAPGTYVALCWIPAPDGESHHTKGMLTEFTVS